MNELTPLNRPVQSQVKIDPTAKECPSEGFNYPTFRQLNKHARVYLSQPIALNPSTPYNLFDVANSKGWFVAVKHSSSGSDLIFSTLEDLRSSFPSAKDSPEELFSPKRTVSTPYRANIVRFAAQDSRLLVAQENGSLLLFDTSQLFTEDANSIHPLTSAHVQTTYVRQIVPNPGTEPGLSDLIAVVSNGKVQLLDTQLEPQGGWTATDLMTQPIAVSWSPKGKHIAIGLQTGDILTYSLTNKATPHKHIPPTTDGILTSLNWLSPGHTFRTSYAAQGDSSPQQHIIVLDTKTSTATYSAPDHPFPISDRNFQSAYVLNFPKWDADSASSDENKSLTIVGDASSIDLEVLGNIGNTWYRQSQENPLSLPLDSSMDDTILLALESDLTDSTAAAPIMYAYLNDGSLQGWHLEHSKPYLGIITPNTSGSSSSTGQVPAQSQEAGKDADMGAEETPIQNAFSQQSTTTTTSAFGQSSFTQQSTSAFGSQHTSAFGKTGFGQKSPQTASAFGQTAFGQPSAFGAASGFGAFGQSNQTESSTSAFGNVKPAVGFGAFGGTNNAFGSSGSSAFGATTSGAFGSLNSDASNAFGQASFSSNTQSTNEPPSSPIMTREASMSDSTPSLGGFGLGSATPTDPNARNSMFGSFSATSSAPTTSDQASGFGSGSLVKPATGFGAFGNFKPSSTFEAPKPTASTTSAFGAPSQPTATSGFGQSGFANSTFGKSAFGQSAFGQPAFGQPAFGKPSLGASTTTTSTSGGFGAFANAPTAFGGAATTSTTPLSSGGFSAFASSAPTTFGTALESTTASEAKPATGGGFGAFSSFTSGNTPLTFGSTIESSEATKEITKSTSAFGGSSTTTTIATSPFAAPSTPAAEVSSRTSVFGTGKSAFAGASSSTASPSHFATPFRPSPFANIDEGSPEHVSPPSSPEPIKSPAAASFTPSSTPNAFSNIQTTPSSFKPASGFGAFGNFGGPNTDSPFFKKPTETPPATSVFALGSSPKTPTSVAAAPTFGSTSALGAAKSTFTPITPPTVTPSKGPVVNAFSAFSGASSSFSAYVPNKTSFADLLKTGGEEATDPEKATTLQSDVEKATSERISVFGTPKTPPKKSPASAVSAFAPIAKDDEKEMEKKKPVSDEPSYGSLSISSTSSSFVDVTKEEEYEEGEVEEPHSDEDAEHSGDEDDTNSFLSETFSDSYQEESAEEGSDKEENELPDIEEEEEEEEESPETPVGSKDLSRSPSATPQPETPSIKISLSPDDDEERPAEPRPDERDRSATPPGSPVKEPVSPFTQPPTTPVANATSPSFGIGLGRPSTRPTRSSPLANAISHSDDDDEAKKPAASIPVSPKVPPVEVLPVKLEEDASLKRPKTPPLLSVLGGNKSPTPATPSTSPASPVVFKSPSPVSAAPPSSTKSDVPGSGGLGALAAAAAASSPSILGKGPDKTPAPSQPLFGGPAAVPPSLPAIVPSLPTVSTPPSLFGGPPFSLKNATVPSAPAGTSGFPSIKSPTLPPMPTHGIFAGSPSPTPTQQSISLFGTPKQTSKTPTPSMFGNSIPGISPPKSSPFAGPSLTPKAQPALSPPASVQRPEAALEEGMQKECMRLVVAMQSDFAQLSHFAQGANKTKEEISSQLGGSRLKADLGDRTKWTLNDLEQFKRVLKQYEADLDLFESNKEKDQQTLREIQSNMLKAGTRREEIARFNKAKDDKEFAKMLRSRTLGPEYSETQAQLRKSIRTIRDRIQKLETHLEEDKKKLAQSTSYKPSFRAPSLDTINRTYRNIEIAIDQQSDEVARLSSRVSKLNIKEATATPLLRDARLPNVVNRQLSDITPNVAAITAAALNAERAASRLKKALLSVRSEPLLNTKAASAPSAPVAFATPKKTPNSGLSLFGETSTAESYTDWDIPPDNFDPSGSPSPSAHRGAAKAKKHQPFKRNPVPTAATAVPVPPGFEWGPLPTFSAPPPAATFSFASFVKK